MGGQPSLLEFDGRDIAQGPMQSFLVEVAPIVLNRPACIGQAVEQFQVQALVPQSAVEALIDAILPRFAWVNIRGLDLLFG